MGEHYQWNSKYLLKHIAINRVTNHYGVKSIAVDEFSIVLYRFIYVTKELALQDINGFAKTFKIPFSVVKGKLVLETLSKAERASLIDLLKERMEIYDVGVSLDLVEIPFPSSYASSIKRIHPPDHVDLHYPHSNLWSLFIDFDISSWNHAAARIFGKPFIEKTRASQ
jgi:hypothetical protein